MDVVSTLFQGSSATQLLLLLAAFLLCSLIGLERQTRQKAAGYRTHVLVGLGSCAFTLVSAYGFEMVTDPGTVLDPSRIAAQIVSGIGFLGAGVIFKGRDAVRGLTTAATIWVSAAVGMTCGAGLIPLGASLTGLHLITLFVVAPLLRKLPTADRKRVLHLNYVDQQGVLRSVIGLASSMGFSTAIIQTSRQRVGDTHSIAMDVRFIGRQPVKDLVPPLMDIEGVTKVIVVERIDQHQDD